jgi:hypothetical protein
MGIKTLASFKRKPPIERKGIGYMPSLTEWDKFRLSMRTLKSLSSIIKDLFTSQDTLHILETVDVVKNIITEDCEDKL